MIREGIRLLYLHLEDQAWATGTTLLGDARLALDGAVTWGRLGVAA